MGEIFTSNTHRILQVGADKVTVRSSELVIEAKRPMPDWEVRDLNPVPIYFEEQKYQLIECRKSAPPFAVRYLLLRAHLSF